MKTIELTRGFCAIIDDEDYERVSKYKWCASTGCNGGVYAVRGAWNPETKKTKQVKLHRWLIAAEPGQFVDHDNGNTLDCRRENLCICTNAENIRKMHKFGSKGVHFTKARAELPKPWQAYIGSKDGLIKRRHLGYFATKEEAQQVYNQAASIEFGEFFAPPEPERLSALATT